MTIDITKVYLSPNETDPKKQDGVIRQLLEYAQTYNTNITHASRTLLTSNIDLYVSPTGSDSTGDGSLGNPWATVTHAWFIAAGTYDLTTDLVTIHLAAGTYNIGAGSQLGFLGTRTVGGQVGGAFGSPTGDTGQIVILGDNATPGNVVLDGGSHTDNYGFQLAAPNTVAYIDGITFQNFQNGTTGAISMDGVGSTLYLGNLNFSNNAVALNTGFNCVMIQSGALSFSGTNNGSITFSDAKSVIDLSVGTKITLVSTPQFGGYIFNVFSAATVYYNTGLTSGTATGTQFNIQRGGSIFGLDGSRNPVASSAMPGSVAGINISGTYNDSRSSLFTFAGLPSTTTMSGGERVLITNATSSPTFGSTVTTGTAVNATAPVYFDGSKWRFG